MSPSNEYAKLVKIKTNNLSDKGFKAKIQLPSSKTLTGPYDYINFYCGLESYECGISCKDASGWKENGVLKWRAFANGESDPTYHGKLFNDGDIVTISLAVFSLSIAFILGIHLNGFNIKGKKEYLFSE